MVAFALAQALLEKLGGDSLDEIKTRFSALRGNKLSDVTMANVAWNFGYK